MELTCFLANHERIWAFCQERAIEGSVHSEERATLFGILPLSLIVEQEYLNGQIFPWRGM